MIPVSSNDGEARRLRRFGLTVATGFALIGALSWWRGHTIAPVLLWAFATLAVATALAAPALLASVERRWLVLGAGLAWINTRVVLTLIFYAVVTPTGVLMRFFYDPLDRRLDEARASYWIRRTPAPFDAKSYERQF